MQRTIVYSSLLAVVLLFSILAETIEAQPRGAIRASSRAISRAISLNTERIIRPRLVVARGSTGPVRALALSGNERFLVTAPGDGSLRVWDLEAGRQATSLRGGRGQLSSLAVDKEGRFAVSVGGGVTMWDLKTGTSRPGPSGAVAAGFAGDTLAVGTSQGSVLLLNPASGTQQKTIKAHSSPIVALAADPGGKAVVTAAQDGSIMRIALPGGQATPLPGKQGRATMLAVGGNVIMAGASDGSVATWTITGQPQGTFRLQQSAVTALGLNESGTLAVIGTQNGQVGVVSTSGGAVRSLGKHSGPVTAAALDRQGLHALTSSQDGSVRMWGAGAGRELLQLLATRDGWSVVDTQGRFDGTQSSLDGIQWQAPEATIPIENTSQRYYEPGLLAQTKAGGATSGVRSFSQGVHLPPMVEVVFPGSAQGGEAVVEVTAVEQGRGGVSNVRLFQNGKRVSEGQLQGQSQETSRGARVVTKRYGVRLAPGSNIMSASAQNVEAIESTPVSTTITGGPGDAPRFWMLAVGVNRYARAGMNLNYAAPDSKALSQFFQSGSRLAFSQGQLRQLTDGQATKGAILQALRSFRNAPPQDTIILYLAGHGQPQGSSWAFVAHDGQGISSEEIKAELDALAATRVFVALDTCYAGKALSPLKAFQGVKSLRLLARDMGVHVIAATDRDQTAVELSSLGHGLFTYTLLQGLRGQADGSPRDSRVSVLEVLRYVENQVPPLGKRLIGHAQYPTAHSRGTDFALTGR